jgi:hypothetical protein
MVILKKCFEKYFLVSVFCLPFEKPEKANTASRNKLNCYRAVLNKTSKQKREMLPQNELKLSATITPLYLDVVLNREAIQHKVDKAFMQRCKLSECFAASLGCQWFSVNSDKRET